MRAIHTYGLEELETLLSKGVVTIHVPPHVGAEYYVTSQLRKEIIGYSCSFADGENGDEWIGKQYGNTLIELLLRGVFGYAEVQPQVIDDTPGKALVPLHTSNERVTTLAERFVEGSRG